MVCVIAYVTITVGMFVTITVHSCNGINFLQVLFVTVFVTVEQFIAVSAPVIPG